MATGFTYPSTEELDAAFTDPSLGYVYSRHGSPTVRALEVAVAAIEGTEDAVAYGSGMAAIHGIVTATVTPKRGIVASRDVYGATMGVLRNVFAPQGIDVTFVDMRDLDAVESTVRERKPALMLAETVSNPLIRVSNVRELVRIAHDAGATFALDNTFASPIVTQGAALGADAVIHSTTKHIGGHGDTTGGVIACNLKLATRLHEVNRLIGSVLSPFDAWLTLRGLRTLDLRVRKQCANAIAIAEWLQNDPRVDTVMYPAFAESLPAEQFRDGLFGTMLAFEVAGADRQSIFGLFDALQLIKPAPTLGDVATLCLHPATSSHRGLTPEERAEIGIKDNLMRISAGIEDAADIIADLDYALAKATATS